MKNIHILPTDQPSRLCIDNSCNELNYSEKEGLNSKHITNQCMYITSDEEIKKGDNFLDLTDNTLWRNHGPSSMSKTLFPECKKIILTTDTTLIVDGVQAIDDEFLEWIVENPTCEYVTVYDGLFGEDRVWKKYIIIPREKPKQFIGRGMKSLIGKDLHGINPPTTESLEEAANRIYPPNCNFQGEDSEYFERIAYINGGTWVMEKMYSEEEVLGLCMSAYNQATKDGSEAWLGTFDKWFEQFKKK